MAFLPTDRLHVEQDSNPLRVLLDVYRWSDQGSKEVFGTSYSASDEVWEDVQGAEMVAGYLKAPITPEVYRAILRFPDGTVTWQSEKLRQKFIYKTEQEGRLIENARIQTRWRDALDLGQEIDLSSEITYEQTKLDLRQHQGLAAHLAKNMDTNSGYGLFMEQGTGKTPVAISSICHLVKKMENHAKVLIVVPPALKLNWQGEIERFSSLPAHSHILKGAKAGRLFEILKAITEGSASGCDYTAIIVAYDTLVSSEEIFTRFKWDIAVADESQWFKDPTTSRAETMLNLRDHCTYRIPLTGTPVGNHTGDLYTQLEWIEEGASMSTSAKAFRSQFNVTVEIGNGIDVVMNSKNTEVLKNILAQRSFVCKKDEVLKDLPSRTFEVNTVEMTALQRKHYKAMAEDLVIQLEEDQSASVQHILTQILRLHQITCGFYVKDKICDDITGDVLRPQEVIHYDRNLRIEYLIEIAKELPRNEKMIIWNHWNPMIDKIFEAFRDAGMQEELVVFRGQDTYKHPDYKNEQRDAITDKDVGAFNADPNRRFLLANPASANMGLTLVGYPPDLASEYATNCTEMVNFSYDWSYLKRAQALDRFHRIGTRRPVRVRDIVVPDTVDTEIMAAVHAKKEVADDVTSLQGVLAKLAGMSLTLGG